MKFNLETLERHSIKTYRQGEVTLVLGVSLSESTGRSEIQTRQIRHSFVLTPETIIEPWPIGDIRQLQGEHLAPILELDPELVLLGSGRVHRFPAAEQLLPLHQARIGVEVMDSGAACRTYNVLHGEGRRVVAAIILD